MTLEQQLITIGLCVLGTMATRFLPFLIFSSKKPTPTYIQYLGKALPSAIFAMLVVYCLKDVEFTGGNHGLLHCWKRQMMLSIAGGTVCYMILVQTVF